MAQKLELLNLSINILKQFFLPILKKIWYEIWNDPLATFSIFPQIADNVHFILLIDCLDVPVNQLDLILTRAVICKKTVWANSTSPIGLKALHTLNLGIPESLLETRGRVLVSNQGCGDIHSFQCTGGSNGHSMSNSILTNKTKFRIAHSFF